MHMVKNMPSARKYQPPRKALSKNSLLDLSKPVHDRVQVL